jgi:hypothetical protein
LKLTVINLLCSVVPDASAHCLGWLGKTCQPYVSPNI